MGLRLFYFTLGVFLMLSYMPRYAQARADYPHIQEEVIYPSSKPRPNSLELIAQFLSNEGHKVTIFTGPQKPISTTPSAKTGFTTVMGFTQSEILSMAGEYRNVWNASACSEEHEQGDLANRWCHASITKAIRLGLEARGINTVIASVLAMTYFISKEYLYDKNPSSSDIVYTIEETFGARDNTAVELTLFADGGVFVAIHYLL